MQSSEINQFIKDRVSNHASWVTLQQELAHRGVNISVAAVRQRGQNMRAKLAPTKFTATGDDLQSQVLTLLKKRRNTTVAEIADEIDVGPSKVRATINELRKNGHMIADVADGIELTTELKKREPLRISTSHLKGRTIKFGLTADNHLGSKYERLDVLNALFDYWEEEGITTIYQLGNMIDGEARFNRQDIHVHGIEGQVQYFVEQWPKRKGMTTHFITGDDHEGWYVQREMIDIGHYIQSIAQSCGRNDLKYLGHMEHDILFEGKQHNVVMRLIHAGGGSSYATSYSVQKIVESYQGGEKPNVLLVGHYHKAEYGYPREVHVVQAGCTCDQTPFMRKNKLQAHVGGWTVEMTINPNGTLSRFKTEWIPFYDKKFYENPWKFQKLASLPRRKQDAAR